MPRKVSGIIHAGGTRVRAVEIDAAIEHFLARLKRDCRPNTLRAYGADVADFQAFFAGRGKSLVGLITEADVERWLDDMSARGCCARTLARRLAVLRRLCRHCKVEGWLSYDPTQDSKVRFRAKRVTAPEMAELLGMIDAIAPIGPAALRDRALLRLTLDAGLRVGEVASLDVPAGQGGGAYTVDLERQLVHVPAKGAGDDTVCIDDTTVAMLRAWLAARGEVAKPDDTALFVSNRGRRFTRQGIHWLVRRRGEAAGLGELHMHLLRHRRIGDLLERCGTQVAQAHARHAHASTTQNTYGAHARQVLHNVIREQGGLPGRAKGRAAA